MNTRRVVITGMGVVSTFGRGVEIFWNSIIEGKSGFKQISLFDSSIYRSGLGAEVPSDIRFNEELRKEYGNPLEDATFFSVLAADEALMNAGLGNEFIIENQKRIGCVIGTLCSSSKNYEDLGKMYYLNELNNTQSFDPAPTLLSYQMNFLCDRYKIKGPASLISTACSSSTDAIGYGFDMIRNDQCDISLVGGGDVISEIIHAGFNSVMSITKDCPRPFDKNRSGFAIGEGAAIIVIESLESAIKREAKIYAEILGYGLSNSAYHLSATSKDGTGEALAIKRAISEAGLVPAQIDYVNCHGTATFHNDNSERMALKIFFGDLAPNISLNSIKSMIGHCMGAAGALEAVATVKSICTGIIPPTINFRTPDDGNDFDLVVNEKREKEINYALSNSFGFAGNNSAVVIGSFNQ